MSATATATATTTDWVELADRAGDGLDVRLYWNRADGRVKVAVTRIPTGQTAEIRVAPAEAMDAFHHPFAYRQSAGERMELLAA